MANPLWNQPIKSGWVRQVQYAPLRYMSDKRHRLALPGNTGRMRPSDHNNSRDAQIAAADYVATQAMELSQLCRGLGLDTLGYLLDMARA